MYTSGYGIGAQYYDITDLFFVSVFSYPEKYPGEFFREVTEGNALCM